MRIFHELVVDEFITDTSYHRGEAHWTAVMGAFEVWRVVVVADQVSGTSPTVYVGAQETPDHTWHSNFFGDVLSFEPLTVGETNVLQGTLEDGVTPAGYGLQILYALGGISPKAHLRIWVTGRGRA